MVAGASDSFSCRPRRGAHQVRGGWAFDSVLGCLRCCSGCSVCTLPIMGFRVIFFERRCRPRRPRGALPTREPKAEFAGQHMSSNTTVSRSARSERTSRVARLLKAPRYARAPLRVARRVRPPLLRTVARRSGQALPQGQGGRGRRRHRTQGRAWAGIEVKLGPGAVDQGAGSLLRVASHVDTDKRGKPASPAVIPVGARASATRWCSGGPDRGTCRVSGADGHDGLCVKRPLGTEMAGEEGFEPSIP